MTMTDPTADGMSRLYSNRDRVHVEGGGVNVKRQAAAELKAERKAVELFQRFSEVSLQDVRLVVNTTRTPHDPVLPAMHPVQQDQGASPAVHGTLLLAGRPQVRQQVAQTPGSRLRSLREHHLPSGHRTARGKEGSG